MLLGRQTPDLSEGCKLTLLCWGLGTFSLVVSDPPHLLRLQYAWFSSFRGTDLIYTLIASNPPWWNPWRWWQNPVSVEFVESEVLKLGYYLLHYRFGL